MSFNFSPKIVTDGLILYLDAANTKSYISGSTTWNDLTKNQNNATLINGPAYNTANLGSIVFDGIDDYVDVAGGLNILSISNYTKTAWFYINSFSTANNIVSGGNTAQHAFWLGGTTNLRAGHNGNWSTVVSTTVLSLNTWYFGAVTFDTITGWKLYLNGIQESTSPDTTPFNGIGYVQLGRYDTGNYFTGRIASTQIYDKVLTQQEILQNYNALKTRFGL